jgi:simple sugar transport system ATP-binding protein
VPWPTGPGCSSSCRRPAGVDVKSKRALMDAAAESGSGGSGVLVVTDDLDDLRYCHRVVVMLRGEVVGELRGNWADD